MAGQVSKSYYFPYPPPPPPPPVFIPPPPSYVSPVHKKRKVEYEVEKKEKGYKKGDEEETEEESEEESEEEESGSESEEESEEEESGTESEEESEEEEDTKTPTIDRLRKTTNIEVNLQRAIKNSDLNALKKYLEKQPEYDPQRLRILAISYNAKKSILNYINKKIIEYECIIAIRTENVAYLRSLEKIPLNIRKMLKDSKSKVIKAFVKKHL